jgi:hypothetical protein
MGKGGMRWGAGRPAHKGKAEACMRLDVREWARRGALVPGYSGPGVGRIRTQGSEQVRSAIGSKAAKPCSRTASTASPERSACRSFGPHATLAARGLGSDARTAGPEWR